MKSKSLNIYFIAATLLAGLWLPQPPAVSARCVQEEAAKNLATELSTRETYVGQAISLRIGIVNAKQYEPPRLPEIDGLDIRSGGTPQRSSRISIYNGRRTESSSIIYDFQITPLREGVFKIPSIDLQIDGKVQSTGEFEFVAGKSETGDLMFAEIVGADEKVYVGQPINLALKIWIRPFSDETRRVKLSEGHMWDRISRNTNWGEFKKRIEELSNSRRRPSGEEVLRKDDDGNSLAYYLYQIDAMVYPQRPGQIDVGDVQVVVNYPTELGASRGMTSIFDSAFDDPFFRRSSNSLVVKSTRPIAAAAEAPPIEVINVPIVGRPNDYRGAVGKYRIITGAQPLKVKAGDPLTLQIELQGDGPMELVQAPPIASMELLTKNFKVADDSLAGYVQDDAKLFTTSIRPRTAGITEIPAIPFSFFNPEREEYETAYSKPIAIEVEESDSLSLDSIVGDTNQWNRNSQPASEASETETALQPVLANFNSNDILNDLDQHVRSPHAMSPWLPLTIPPILFLACFAFTRRDWFVAKFASGSPEKKAISRINKAQSIVEIASAIETTYLLDEGANRHTLPIKLQEVLAKCDQAAFSPLKSDSLNELKASAISALSSLNSVAGQSPIRQSLVTRILLLALCGLLQLQSFNRAHADELQPLNADQRRLVLSEANALYSQAMNLRTTDSAESKQLLEKAISKFELLASNGTRSGKLFFNIGNAHLQTGNLGLAIANFEQAHRLAPSEAAVKTNLQFARHRLASSSSLERSGVTNTISWNRLRDTVFEFNRRVSTRLTWWVGLLAWSSIWLLLAARFFSPLSRLPLVRSRAVMVLMVIVFLMAFGSYAWSLNSDTPFDGVAIDEIVNLRQADGEGFPTVGEVGAGERVKLLDQRGQWLKVRSTNTNNVGWVTTNQIFLLRG